MVIEASHLPELPYRSFFGYPVKNTGIEKLALTLLIFLLIQFIPMPGYIAALVSPASHDLYESASKSTGVPIQFHPLSLDSFATFSRFVQYGAYFMIYMTAVNTLNKRPLYISVFYAIVASALFQTVYGLYELFSGGQHIWTYKKKYFLNCATGTFINRNHYSAYVGSSIPLVMTLILTQFIGRKAKGQSFLVRISRFLDSKGLFIMFPSFVVLSLGVVFSLSLTGIMATMLSCLAFLYFYGRIQQIRKTFWIVVLVGIIAVGALFTTPRIRDRVRGISAEFVSERSRFMVWQDTFHIFLRFPLVGTGAGTFSEIFPVYRSFGTTTSYTSTHNEYLQLLSEIGISAAFIAVVLFQALLMGLRRTLEAPASRLVLMQTGAFSALLLLGLHNLVDFSFEIPAVAVMSMVLAALFFASYHEEQKTRPAN